ncbi:diaminopimelate decarboxylase [Kitasatospora acidiphila]|uniref:Diaminopimelate decarboxylase n=1 Tax=Kitasatospora acidiphila TaxID=2567942 RepID=A0A540WBB9_9ACTN|nr:diaminopimelate decarboxylase [Kitasatospora acidiphila]TQF06306.1 diaminopimelate decarboxylase [Kitasatospora acidiphila]
MTTAPYAATAEPTDPLSGPRLARVAQQYGTPAWVYDADRIRAQIARLRSFDVIRFAQKACSNTHILRLMRTEGVLVDAVSLGEIERALTAGYQVQGADEPVVFTADLLDRATLRRVVELRLPVNAGSPQMLEQLGAASPGHPVWLRINPGFGHGHSRKTNTGGEQSKHGIWHEHLGQSLELVDRYGLELIGLHMHIGSGVDYGHLEAVCETMVKQVRLSDRDVRAISAGGGLTVPYHPGRPEVDTERYFRLWDSARQELVRELGHPVRLEIEPGRFLVAGSGALVSEVRAQKPVGSNHFVLVDAGFNDLMRPAMYGSSHRVSVLAPGGEARTEAVRDTVLAGPLCESGDVFTQAEGGDVEPIPLPRAEIGDLVVFHDTGAYGASMSSNYNSRPLLPEVLVDGGQAKLIRRRQTVAELLALETEVA